MKADSARTIFYALGANLAIAAAKTGAAVATGSSAMPAGAPACRRSTRCAAAGAYGNGSAELVAAINRAEAALRRELPEIQWLFVEPGIAD